MFGDMGTMRLGAVEWTYPIPGRSDERIRIFEKLPHPWIVMRERLEAGHWTPIVASTCLSPASAESTARALWDAAAEEAPKKKPAPPRSHDPPPEEESIRDIAQRDDDFACGPPR